MSANIGASWKFRLCTTSRQAIVIGTFVQVRNLAECMRVAFDAGAKRIHLPMSSVLPT